MSEVEGVGSGHAVAGLEIRAVHDGTWAYFLFLWDDPTRSLKHLQTSVQISSTSKGQVWVIMIQVLS